MNTVLLLVDVKLLVYGEKRQKPKLICLQHATLYSTTQVLLFEIFQISLIWYHWWGNWRDFKTPIEDIKAYSISPERSNHTIFMEKAKVVMYKSRLPQLAVHISLNPMGRSFQWQLRRLTWTNLFERSTNQPLFPAVFFPLNTINTFDFSCYRLMKSCGLLHGCTSRRAKFCSLLSQFLGYFSSFL